MARDFIPPIAAQHTASVKAIVSWIGAQTLGLAGRIADGTITWMTAPEVIVDHTVPVINAAADAAGRNEKPRVIVALPVCVTSDVDVVRKGAAKAFARYGTLPSYRAMLARAGLDGPGDAALIGSEDQVGGRIQILKDAGADEFVASVFAKTPEDQSRTKALLQSFLS